MTRKATHTRSSKGTPRRPLSQALDEALAQEGAAPASAAIEGSAAPFERTGTLTAWPIGAGALEPGALISDRYRIMELLCGGETSRLYLAEQIGLGRPVALKTIFRECLAEPQSMGSFLQEARVLARVNHPNIISVYGVGETAIGERYIAMEYVPGETLAELLDREGALPLRRAVSILLQLARALGSVHREGVIHRDLSPSNVLVVTTTAGVDIVKVADFGLAKVMNRKALAHDDDEDAHALGTPEYMSPEQVSAHGLDHRSDIYSLGCIGYAMLTGSPPFTGTRAEVLQGHAHDAPAPLANGDDGHAIPAAFEPVIARALAKAPEDRYASAFELYAAALQAADDVGIARRELHLVESLFDDPAYSIVHEGNRDLGGRDRRSPGPELPLRWLVVALLIGVLGIAIARWSTPERVSAPNSAHAAAPSATSRIVVTQPAGDYVMLDRTDVWKKVPTAFDSVTPGKHRLHFGVPKAIRATYPVLVAPGEAHVVSLPE